MNTTRKSITILKINKDYVEDLVQKQQIRSFSKAVDNMITEKRRQDEEEVSNSSTDAI